MNKPLAKNVDDFLKACACGNAQAYQFLVAWLSFCELIDDIVDSENQDQLTDENLVLTLLQFIVNVSSNQFYQSHRIHLEPAIVNAANDWLDANRMLAAGDPAGHVLKSGYHQVFWTTARLAGGWDRMREICKQYRSFDKA